MGDEVPELTSTTTPHEAPSDAAPEVNSTPATDVDGVLVWNSMDLPGMEPADDNE
jgi:hypothetical protein